MSFSYIFLYLFRYIITSKKNLNISIQMFCSKMLTSKCRLGLQFKYFYSKIYIQIIPAEIFSFRYFPQMDSCLRMIRLILSIPGAEPCSSMNRASVLISENFFILILPFSFFSFCLYKKIEYLYISKIFII